MASEISTHPYHFTSSCHLETSFLSIKGYTSSGRDQYFLSDQHRCPVQHAHDDSTDTLGCQILTIACILPFRFKEGCISRSVIKFGLHRIWALSWDTSFGHHHYDDIIAIIMSSLCFLASSDHLSTQLHLIFWLVHLVYEQFVSCLKLCFSAKTSSKKEVTQLSIVKLLI